MSAAFIFDLDGTLYPYDQAYTNACLEAVDKSQGRVRRFFMHATGGNQNHDRVADITKLHGLHASTYGLPRVQARHLDDARRALTTNFMQPNPALIGALEYAKASNIPLYLFTHSEQEWADNALDSLELNHLFPHAHRVTKESGMGRKSAPETFQRFLAHFALPRDADIVLFDDTLTHEPAAKANGIEFLHVPPHQPIRHDMIRALTDTIKARHGRDFQTPAL